MIRTGFLALAMMLAVLPGPRVARGFSVFFGDDSTPTSLATTAPRWSAESYGGIGLHDHIQVAVDPNFAADLGAASVASLYGVDVALVEELIELAVRRAFETWETSVLRFDVTYGGAAVEGATNGYELDLFADAFELQFFGFADVETELAPNLLLTNGQRVAGNVIVGADVFINTTRLQQGAAILHGYNIPLELLGAALQILVAHEVGHAFGLGHPNLEPFLDTDTDPYNPMSIDPASPFSSLMFSSIPSTTPGALLPIMWGNLSSDNTADLLLLLGRLSDPQLTNDDRAGRDVLYPTALPPVPLGCSAEPVPYCMEAAEPMKSGLVIKKSDAGPSRDSFSWKWGGGEATLASQFGNPITSNSYALCIYGNADSVPTLVSELRAPGGDVCDGKPCWKGSGKPAGAKGWKYKDKELTPSGVLNLALKPGADGKAKMTLKGKGESLPLPAMPITTFPWRVQLQGAGRCWQTDYAVGNALENSAALLKLKGPTP